MTRPKRPSSRTTKAVLRETVARFSRDSLLDLVGAASSSPTAAHRSPSLAVVFAELLHSARGDAAAGPGDLDTLLDAARTAEPYLVALEDYTPSDCRRDVRVRWGSEMFRLLPGSIERPVAMLERARLVADSVDSVLLKTLEFTLSDVCELMLRHMNVACACMSESWATEPTDEPGGPAVVNAREVAQAAALPTPADSVARCRHPERALRVLKWATSDSSRVSMSPSRASFGHALQVRATDGTVVPIPIGFWPEALDTIINDLATIAVQVKPDVDAAFSVRSAAELARVLRRLRQPIRHRVEAGDGTVHSLIAFDRNQQVLVALSAGLKLAAGDLEASEQVLVRCQSEAKSVVRMHVIASSGHAVVSSDVPGVVATTLDDVAWIVDKCSEEPDDFFLFFKELLEHKNVGQLLTLETINAFEYWRHNGKALFIQGGEYNFAVLPFHLGDEEWREAARRTPLESALLKLGLSRSSCWDAVSYKREAGEAMLTYWPSGPAWLVRTALPVVGIHCFDSQTPQDVRQLILSLSVGIHWRVDKSEPVKELISHAIGDGALKLWCQPEADDRDAPVVRARGWSGGRLVLGFGGRLQQYCEEHSTEIELVIGEAIATGLAERGVDRDEFVARWTEAPSGFRMDAAPLPVGRQRLPPPHRMNTAMTSEASRELATRLRESGLSSGEYKGRGATALETERIFPTLLEILADAIAPFSVNALVDCALEQLEYALCQRHVDTLTRGWNEQFPSLAYDPIERRVSEEEHAIRLAGAIRVVIEEVLRNPPAGTQSPDRFDWWRLLAIGELCAQSGLRSESNHYGLAPVMTTVSSMHEIDQQAVGESLLDIHAYKRAKAQGGEVVGTPLLPTDLEPVALAMQSALGFRPETVGLVLQTISAWEVTPERPFGVCTVEELIQVAHSNRVREDSAEEVRNAVTALILARTDLEGEPLEHWEQERRRARLMTKPIVEMPDGKLRVLPWQSYVTWRVFQGYLSEGRFVWPAAALSAGLQNALAAFIRERNRDLERDTGAEFRKLTPHVRENVKKPKVLGLTSGEWVNAGEIDALAVDEATKTVWVAETKDLFSPFSPSTMRRSYQKYFNSKNGYAGRLLKKTEMIRSNRIAVTASFGVDSSSGHWQVRPIMVTRRVEPAGFARSSPVSFCTLSTLEQFIRAARGD